MAPTLNFSNVEQLYGNKWYFYHRVDMHRQLREQAQEAGALIRLGKQVVDIDPETGVVSLKDGKNVQKDLVVIADGQHVSKQSTAAFMISVPNMSTGSAKCQGHQKGSPNEAQWPDRISMSHPHEGHPGRRGN